MRAKLLTILLLCGVTGLSAQQATRRILYDFRVAWGFQAPGVKDAMLSPKVKGQILSALFPKYLTDDGGCKEPLDNAKLEEAGQIVPSIGAYADGSFTAPGRRQTAYSIKVNECFVFTDKYMGTYRLAIFEGPRLIAKYTKGGLLAAADVNNDGIDELLLGGFEFGMGEMRGDAALVSLRGGELRTIRAFDGYDNDCNAMREAPRVTASVIAYTPTQLFVEQYEAPWIFVGDFLG